MNAHGHVGFQKDTSFDKANHSRESIINQLKQYAYYGTGAIMTAGTDFGDVSYEIRDNPVPGAAPDRLVNSSREDEVSCSPCESKPQEQNFMSLITDKRCIGFAY